MENKAVKYNKFNAIILKISFAIASLLFVIPSIMYYINEKTVFKFNKWFLFLLNNSERAKQVGIYIVVMALMALIYTLILKSRNTIFKNIKSIFIYILIISCIFVIAIPFMCSDVFYYLGIGRLAGEYEKNPYYDTIKGFVETENNIQLLEKDSVLHQGYLNDWAESICVYGPLWALICEFISMLSFGNVDLGLFVFKILNVVVHMLNCLLIYKLSKNKKIFVLLYGLCPFVLVEGICSVHNDMYVLLFLLTSLYFVKNKNNLNLGIVFLMMATAIKYFAILFLPFIVIYYFRKEKLLKKILYCILYGMFFLVLLALPYLVYIRDLKVLSGLFMQQEKIAKSIYVILLQYFTYPSGIVTGTSKYLLMFFVILFFFICVDMLINKKLKFRFILQNMLYILLFFVFVLITQFQPWYLLWIYSVLVWQKSKNIKLIIQVTMLTQFANAIFLLNGEGWQNGTPYTFVMWLGLATIALANQYLREIRKKRIFLKQLKSVKS